MLRQLKSLRGEMAGRTKNFLLGRKFNKTAGMDDAATSRVDKRKMRRGLVHSPVVGIAMRGSALLFIGAMMGHALYVGDYFNNPDSAVYNLSGKVAGFFGYAANNIHMSGLSHHKKEAVLAAIGVRQNGSMIGFNPLRARNILENTDWVAEAQVKQVFPNGLEISVLERTPFAVWQRGGEFYVIDRSGLAISSVSPQETHGLLMITGEGAAEKVADLVNQLEATPSVKSLVKAAARVGERRWTLYLDGDIKVMMPEDGRLGLALMRLEKLALKSSVLDKKVATIDLRRSDRGVFVVKHDVRQGDKFSSR